MKHKVRLYISSSPDLEGEREAIGQAVAELPIDTGWELRHTARFEQSMDEALDFIASCDLYLIALGGDFAAPMGLEWEQAQRTHRPTLGYLKDGSHSPSARSLLRQADLNWTDFRSVADFKGGVKRALARFLLDRGETLGLFLEDVEGLLTEIARQDGPGMGAGDRRRGAGESAVILGRQ
jgi:hypothetical protein